MRFYKSPHFILLTFCFLFVHIGLFSLFGVRSFYDSTLYVKSADHLLARGSFEDVFYFFYAIPVLLMAACRAIFPETVFPFLLLQITISGVAMIYLYKASESIFQSSLAAFLSVLIFLLWWDNFHWNTTVMTESIFCSLLCFLIYRLAIFKNSYADWIFLSVLSLAAVMTRPTGMLIVIGVVIFLLCHRWKYVSFLWRPVIIGGCIVAAVSGAYVMFSVWDFTDQYNRGNVITYADVAEAKRLNFDGMRIDADGVVKEQSKDHPMIRMLRFVSSNPVHFLKAAGMKVGYLLSATRPYYSWLHNLFSLVWLVLVYTLSYVGYRKIESGPLRLFVAAVIVLNCALVAISSVDWDNRFYIPMYPCIALIAGGGGAFLINRPKST